MFLALRELKHAKVRFFLIGFIMMLIAWLVFMLSGLANGLNSDNGAAIKNMNGDYISYQEGSRVYLHRSIMPIEKVEEIKDVDGVEDATPIGHYTATVLKDGEETKIDATVLAIDAEGFIAPDIVEGKSLADSNSKEVAIDKTFQTEYGYEIGDTLELESTDTKWTVAGFTEGQKYNHLPVIFSTVADWEEVKFTLPATKVGIEHPISGVVIKADTDIRETVDKNVEGLETVNMQQALQGLPGYSAENASIMMMLVFLFLIATFVLAVFFYVLTIQKSNQFGVLKALGASSSYLAKSVLSQIFVLSIVSILIGILLTYGTAAIMPSGMPFALSSQLVIIYSFILLFVSMLSSLLSMRRITKIDPLQAIGRVE